MFDLVDECGQDLKNYGYTVKKLDKFGISLASLVVSTDEESKKVKLAKGEYYIFNSPFVYALGNENISYLISLLSKQLKIMLKNLGITKNSKILIIGLGNPDIACDRLGKIVFDYIEINPLNKNNKIFKFCPNIFFSTGIDTQEMVKLFASELKVDLIIIIDSLATNNLSRLGTSFQLTSSGMTPGSGVNRFGKRICKESVGKECISIGVPFMIFSSSLTDKYDCEIVLAPKDVKENVEQAGYIISKAIREVIL